MKYNKILIIMLGVFLVGIVGGVLVNSSLFALTPEVLQNPVTPTELEVKEDKSTKVEQVDNDDEDDDDEDSDNESQGKRIYQVTKSQIEAATGERVTFNNVKAVQKALEKRSVWEQLGFSVADAKEIASRVNKSSDQVRGILRGVSKADNLALKVIILDDGHVNLGKGKTN